MGVTLKVLLEARFDKSSDGLVDIKPISTIHNHPYCLSCYYCNAPFIIRDYKGRFFIAM